MALFRRIKEPLVGSAQVTSASGMPEGGTAAARCRMHLVVQVPGIEPYTAEMTKIVKAKRWPYSGMVLPVTVDGRDPTRVEIDWDQVPTRDEVARQQAQQTAQAMGASPAAAGDGLVPPEAQAIIDQLGLTGAQVVVDGRTVVGTPATAAQGPPADDRIAQLERLAALHQQGVLTDAELATEKARILGS